MGPHRSTTPLGTPSGGLASLRSGTPEGCTRLGYWFARFSRHMRLNFAHFARSHTSCARASRATCAWTSRASRATCAWTSRAYTSKIEDMAEKKFALRASRALRALALREPHALELRALRALGPRKLKKCMKKKKSRFARHMRLIFARFARAYTSKI